MIITLKGKITHKLPEGVILDVGGIGYEVFLNVAALSAVKVGQAIRFWTFEHLREDTQELYGFLERAELDLHRRLVGVSGVGSKMAQHILGLGTVSEVEAIIERGDVDAITKVHRVGRKTAQKIVLELKGKLVQPDDVRQPGGSQDEVVVALVGMGVDRRAARDAATAAAETEESVEGRLKEALRHLGK